jgi:phosphoribosylaminoimidazole (AIR) synthetase
MAVIVEQDAAKTIRATLEASGETVFEIGRITARGAGPAIRFTGVA